MRETRALGSAGRSRSIREMGDRFLVTWVRRRREVCRQEVWKALGLLLRAIHANQPLDR